MNITDEQKRIQQVRVYELPQNPALPTQYTHEQLEFLRWLIQQHDAQNAAIMREFDLNKPPTPPYRYLSFRGCSIARARPPWSRTTMNCRTGWRMAGAKHPRRVWK